MKHSQYKTTVPLEVKNLQDSEWNKVYEGPCTSWEEGKDTDWLTHISEENML